MKAGKLLALYSVSFWRHDLWKSVTTLLGLALGLALYAGVQIANRAALESFEDSAAILRGGADFEISSVVGEVREEVVEKIRALEYVASVEPLSRRNIEVRAGTDSLGVVQVLGMNVLGEHRLAKRESAAAPTRDNFLPLLRRRDAVWISSSLNNRLQGKTLEIMSSGEPLSVHPVFTIPENPLLPGDQIIFDIASFQDFFESYGFVDSLQVFLKSGVSAETSMREIAKLLGDELIVDAQGQNARHAKKMTEAFRLNLQFLSGISIFVALLLVYNTISFFVLKRRKDFGILQTLGVSPKDIKLLLLFEALVLGFLGAILGLFLGKLGGLYALRRVAGTLQNIYGQSGTLDSALPTSLIIEVLLLGPALAIFGSIPARELFSVQLRETFSYQNLEASFHNYKLGYAFLGVVLALLCMLSADARFLELDTRMGFAAPTLAVLSVCFFIPLFLSLSLRILRAFRLPLEFLLASDHVQSTLRRNSVAVASLAVALGMGFSLSIMIVSFRETVSRWITAVTKADVFVSGEFRGSTILGDSISEKFVEAVKTFPEVRDYDPISAKTYDFEGRLIRVVGARMEVIRDSNRLLFQVPMSDDERKEATARADTVFVSEVFAGRTKKKVGDAVEIPGKLHNFTGRIANIFYDYSSDQGVVVVSQEAFEKMYGRVPLQGIALYLRNASDVKHVIQKLQEGFPGLPLKIRDNMGLRQEVLRVFDETFKITYALQLIAIFVSAATLMNTLSMLALERRREFGVLRAIGASYNTLRNMVLAEALLVGAAGLTVGLFLGFLLSLLLVFVVNTHFFGWSIAYLLPWQPLVAGSLLTLTISLLTGGIHASKRLTAVRKETLRYE